MDTGKIKKLERERGFGFITTSGGTEVFFHRSECRQVAFDSLKEGQEISFDVEPGPKGPRAQNVRPVSSS